MKEEKDKQKALSLLRYPYFFKTDAIMPSSLDNFFTMACSNTTIMYTIWLVVYMA